MSNLENEAQSLQTSLFLQNVVKLIPVEIIALFAIIQGFIPTDANPISVWIVLGVLTVMVPFYVTFAMRVKKIDQIILMTIAFPIWVIAIGGLPAASLIAWFEPWMVSVALALFTLVPPMIYGERASVKDIENSGGAMSDVSTSSKSSIKSWREV